MSAFTVSLLANGKTIWSGPIPISDRYQTLSADVSGLPVDVPSTLTAVFSSSDARPIIHWYDGDVLWLMDEDGRTAQIAYLSLELPGVQL